MFIPTLESEPESDKDEQIRVFISYARKDSEAAERLYNDLKSARLLPWMDRPSSLRTGQMWNIGIRKAIRNSRYFIPLFSSKSEAFERTQGLQTDFKYAMDIMETLPENKIHIIPARLDDCNFPVSVSELVKKLEYVDLFPDWNKGLDKIFAAVGRVSEFEFAIEEGDIPAFCSDVIARLYAQHFYGADTLVNKLEEEGIPIDSLRPLPDKYCYVGTAGLIKARFVLFVGVPNPFTYKEIREFATRVIDIVHKEIPHAEHIAMAIHGSGMGLDEVKSLFAQFAGVQDGMLAKGTSSSVKRISIVDRNYERVQRFRNALQKKLASINYVHELKHDGSLYRITIGKIHSHHVIYGDATKEINTMPDTRRVSSINAAVSHTNREIPTQHELVENKNGIFISYSRRDRRWLERLQIHLKPLIRDLDIIIWDDIHIKAGTKWKEEIIEAISNAKVAILLISADFMASEFISSNELPPILANAKNNGTTIFPVILSASWFTEDRNLGQYQAANKTSKPLNELSRAQQEKALYQMSRDISSHFSPLNEKAKLDQAVKRKYIPGEN